MTGIVTTTRMPPPRRFITAKAATPARWAMHVITVFSFCRTATIGVDRLLGATAATITRWSRSITTAVGILSPRAGIIA